MFWISNAVLLLQDATPPPLGAWEVALGFVEAVVWPLTIVALAFGFRKHIVTLVRSIRELRFGAIRATLAEMQTERAATIEHLRELAVALAVPAAASLPGFIAGKDHDITFQIPDVPERLKAAHDVAEALVELGVERKAAEAIMLPMLSEHVRNAHIKWIRALADEVMSPDESNSLLRKTHEYPVLDKLKSKEATVAEARSALSEMLPEWPEEIDGRLDDLDHFDKTGSIRRPDVPPWTENK